MRSDQKAPSTRAGRLALFYVDQKNGGDVSTRFGQRARVAALAAISALALALTACSGAGGLTGDESVNTVDAGLADGIQSAVQNAMALSGSTAAVVGVWQGDSAAYVQGFGDGVNANAPIRAAQASQPVICALVLDLVESGELTLDREISEDMPRQVGIDGITYGQLCNQTAGLADFKIGISEIFINNPTRQWSDRELTAQALARSPLSWPGLDVHVSDSNALMLGRALRLGQGESLADLLQTHVFDAVGMNASYYPTNPLTDMTLPGGGMQGSTYPVWGGAAVCEAGITELPKVSPSMLAGAGATVTTVTDLKRFYENYLGGAFGAGSAELITTVASTQNPTRDESGAALPPAEGWVADPGARQIGFGLEQVETLYGMSGAMTGTITAAYHDPATGFSVVVALNNSTAGAGFARILAMQLAALGGAQVSWSADDQAAALATLAVCPQPAEEVPAEEAPVEG